MDAARAVARTAWLPRGGAREGRSADDSGHHRRPQAREGWGMAKPRPS